MSINKDAFLKSVEKSMRADNSAKADWKCDAQLRHGRICFRSYFAKDRCGALKRAAMSFEDFIRGVTARQMNFAKRFGGFSEVQMKLAAIFGLSDHDIGNAFHLTHWKY